MKTYTVGQLAKVAGVTVKTLHHYEAEGLLMPAGRSAAGYRHYGVAQLERLAQIQLLRQMGLGLNAIAECLDRPGVSLAPLLQAHVHSLEQRIRQEQVQLQQLKHLLGMIQQQQPGEAELEHLLEQLSMLEEYFDPQQLNELRQRGAEMGNAAMVQAQQDWQAVFDGFARAQGERLAFDSAQVTALVDQARGLLSAFTQGRADHQASLQRMYQQESPVGMMRGFGMNVTDEVWDYYSQAMQHHSVR